MIAGIDLGTTNSLVAIWKDGSAQLVPNALRGYLTPSVVGIDDNGEILVGSPAVDRMLTHPELTTSVFKRSMGTNKTTRLGDRDFRPEELSALVLRSLSRDVETWTGEKVEEAVISVPAYFNDAQRKATRIAGQLAGLKVERLVNEPTAAALAYGLHHAKPESQFLVFDLGGGTFDVTVLELFEGVMEVRASAGDNFLGGEDFVAILIDRFLEFAGTPQGLTRKEVSANPKLYQAVRREAERAKRGLTESSETRLSFRWNDKTIDLQISESQFKDWVGTLLDRIRHPVERALRDARIRPSDLNEILLVGGATRMPIVRGLVTRMFGRFPATHINPDEAIALGAAVQAGLKARDSALREVVLTDVCPYTLGVEVAQESTVGKGYESGFFHPIIERNTVIPASRVQQFTTIKDRQSVIVMGIFQGECRLVKDNIFLGRVHLEVPSRAKGEEKVDVRFTYDINGLLEVEATVISTGLRRSIVIEENPGVLSPSEIAERLAALAKLKIHPLDQTENRTVLARAERLYEEQLGEIRELIGFHTKKFTDVLSRQDPREIDRSRAEFVAFLDSIEEGRILW